MSRGARHDGAGPLGDRPPGKAPLEQAPLGEGGRPFPAEHEWLDLELPAGEAEQLASASTFAAHVLDTLRAERELDAGLDRLDDALPTELLAEYGPPEPSPDFVASTLAAARRERGDRWRALLARHVAPDPSPEFVSRTLRALARDDGTPTAARRGGLGRGPLPGPLPWLVAAAAVALVWLAWNPPGATTDAPLELRLARSAPPAAAWADAPTPLPAVLARAAATDEPFAVFGAPTDGLWLAALSGGAR